MTKNLSIPGFAGMINLFEYPFVQACVLADGPPMHLFVSSVPLSDFPCKLRTPTGHRMAMALVSLFKAAFHCPYDDLDGQVSIYGSVTGRPSTRGQFI